MIFSELYSAYYNAVAAVIGDIISGERDEKALQKTVMRHAFSESVLTILPSLKNEKWQLVKGNMTTPIKHVPSMPLTLLEKRWLRALFEDPRIRLFDLSFEGIWDVEPLFTPEDYVVYDKYADGDPYFDEKYITHFRTVLKALRENTPLAIETVNKNGAFVKMKLMPQRLEYSEKDDKFRLISSGTRYGGTVNIARIVSCRPCPKESFKPSGKVPSKERSVTLRITDERNALERCMLHFAHFKKQAEHIGEKSYLIHIKYDLNDETEMVIRILGFGPLVEVTHPESFRRLIIERLKKQKDCGLF